MRIDDVRTSMETISKEIVKVFNFFHKSVEQALKVQDYEKAKNLLEECGKIKDFKERLNWIKTELKSILIPEVKTESTTEKQSKETKKEASTKTKATVKQKKTASQKMKAKPTPSKKPSATVSRTGKRIEASTTPSVPQKTATPLPEKKFIVGLKTPEKEYIYPLLETLLELGGKAYKNEVRKRVYEKMKDKLKPYDLESIPSNPRVPRWEDTMSWTKQSLIKKGFMKKIKEVGIWEISDQGREYYLKLKEQKEQPESLPSSTAVSMDNDAPSIPPGAQE
ncbi:MAG: hypothetical protein N3A69_15305 [Leptospiraceae bacterium]|nr:hypothetical protein [Leptospiraceae bacterium]